MLVDPLQATLELSAAVRPFTRPGRSVVPADRERLRRATLAILVTRGAVVPRHLIKTPEEALAVLRDAIAACRLVDADWRQVVAIVNREPAAHAASSFDLGVPGTPVGAAA